ncbi:MAG: hypothetical protein ACRDGE_08035 [Candidatus Limnocylindria bacterium]
MSVLVVARVRLYRDWLVAALAAGGHEVVGALRRPRPLLGLPREPRDRAQVAVAVLGEGGAGGSRDARPGAAPGGPLGTP